MRRPSETRDRTTTGVQQRLRAIGLEPMPSTPAQFDKMAAEQQGIVAALAKKAGIQAQ